VTKEEFNPDWTRDKLLVTPRPNVRQQDYRPWHVANSYGPIGSAARAAATPGRIEDVDWDWHDRTYTWQCKCGARPIRRHDRIGAYWLEHVAGGNGRVVATVGRDL